MSSPPASVYYTKAQRAAANAIRGTDLYETPSCAVTSLLAHVDLPDRIWEPCAGRSGAITFALRDHGKDVYESDLVLWPRHRDEPRCVARDFLDFDAAPDGYQCILTNPPYMSQLPAKMALHGLTLVPRLFFLLRLVFLEGKSKRRCELLDSGHLKTVYVYRDRLPRMHRDGWTGPKATNSTAFAWFEFDRSWQGPTTIARINSTDGLKNETQHA